MLGLSYWVVPIFSAVVWTAMLITMLVYWAATGKPHYVTMSEGQNIPYISGELCNMALNDSCNANGIQILVRITSKPCSLPCPPSLS